MKVGDWVRATEDGHLYRVRDISDSPEAVGVFGWDANRQKLRQWTFLCSDLHVVTPTSAELEQWRAALAKVGLCLLEDKEVGREPL